MMWICVFMYKIVVGDILVIIVYEEFFDGFVVEGDVGMVMEFC